MNQKIVCPKCCEHFAKVETFVIDTYNPQEMYGHTQTEEKLLVCECGHQEDYYEYLATCMDMVNEFGTLPDALPEEKKYNRLAGLNNKVDINISDIQAGA